MPDTRTVAHEVQEQLFAAVQRGHKQLRKSQEQLRKSQEQFRKGQDQLRKGREAVNAALRSGNELAKAVRPNLPALPGKGRHLPPFSALTDPAKLRAHAQEIAGQFAATQRTIAEKALHTAGPLVIDSVARLNQVAKSFLEQREHASAATAEPESQAKPGADTAEPDAAKAAAPKTATAKAATPKASSARTATTKAGTAKAGTTKATGSSKSRTAKAKD